MEAFFLKLVNMSITASWLVLAIIAVRLIFKKTPKWILCLLWGLVAFRLICPFSIESALSLIPSAEPLPQEIIYTAHPEIQSGVTVIDNAVNPMLESSMTPIEPASANPTQIWSFILSQVWILGMVLMLLYTVISYLLLKRKVATAIPLGKGIKQSEFVDSPFVLGLFRPVIYLPFSMNEADMAYVLAHEKAHIRRRDHWWKPFGFLLLSIYWFNPVLWVAYILLCRDIEAACDEKVIKDMGRDARRAYSTALLNCSIHRRRIAACPLAFGEVGVKARVKGVMHYKKPAFWVILIAVIVSSIVAVCFLTNPDNSVPITMGIEYFNRTMAHVVFQYDDKLSEGEYQISEGYTLEVLNDGKWQALNGLTKERSSFEIAEVGTENWKHDAWSILRWEDDYGRLPDGTYRIRKDITINPGSHESKTDPVYVEFTIGGTAEEYITYSLEDITLTGANLYEHEKRDDQILIYHGPEGFWLEALQDGKWQYMEPTEEVHSVLPKEKYYIYALHYPSSHIELDWSGLYGELPDGTYRIAREITNTDESVLRLCTVYAEFTLEKAVTVWFNEDWDSERISRKSNVMTIPGIDGMTLHYSNVNRVEILADTQAGVQTIFSGMDIPNVFLSDLNEDGIDEICATVQESSDLANKRIQVYDFAANQLYELQSNLTSNDKLAVRNDRLVMLRADYQSGNILDMGVLTLQDDGYGSGQYLRKHPLDDSFQEETKTVSCVDILTRKRICLSSTEEMERVLSLIHDLEGRVEEAPDALVTQAKEDTFNRNQITINYELGEKVLYFSQNYSLVWEADGKSGWLLEDPEPLRSYVGSIMDGVRNKTVSGEPFASMDAPWDWCTGIHSGAVKTAEAHATIEVEAGGSTASMGVISSGTLQKLIDILNQIPRGAFVKSRITGKESINSVYNPLGKLSSSIFLLDDINGLAVTICWADEKVELMLTNELEKAQKGTALYHSYLEPTQVWQVEDDALQAFMQTVWENPPVINYFVGAEYEWQNPVRIQSGDFFLNLRLPEGWICESVDGSDNSGIRCRPEMETAGWIYFSFWPKGYEPDETDRYINTGSHQGNSWFISYPSEVSQGNSFNAEGAIWSYQRICTNAGDYAIINDGADSWFLEYQDQIEDSITLSEYAVE